MRRKRRRRRRKPGEGGGRDYSTGLIEDRQPHAPTFRAFVGLGAIWVMSVRLQSAVSAWRNCPGRP